MENKILMYIDNVNYAKKNRLEYIMHVYLGFLFVTL